MSNSIINSAAQLRGKGQFQEAIDLIEDNILSFDDTERPIALLQAFHSAKEGNMISKAKEFAKAIAKDEPEIPSIQPYLSSP